MRLARRRGIALILALLTTVILVTLSMAFMSLSLSEARTSRTYGYEETSVQAASAAIELAIVYMGHGTDLNTWEFKDWPNPSGQPSMAFGFYNVLRATPDGVANMISPSPQLSVSVLNITQDPGLEAFVPKNVSAAEQTRIRGDLRRLRFNYPPNSRPVLGQDLQYDADVVVEPILLDRNQGRHDYRLISTARIYQAAPSVQQIPPGQEPVATRVIEARVKESSFDYAHFVANARSWNVQGYTIDTLPYAQPNNPNGPLADLTDYVKIPNKYIEDGPMRIDGQAPVDPSATQSRQRVVGSSGNLHFSAGLQDGDVRFTHKLFINQPNNVYEDQDIDDGSMGGFNAGLNPSAMRVGIPDFRNQDMILASQLVVDPNGNPPDRSGYIPVATSEIPGVTNLADAPKPAPDPSLGPFQEYQTVYDETTNSMKQVIKDFDFRPRFPNVEVTLDGENIHVLKRDTKTNAVIPGSEQDLTVRQLKMGVLYVQGGNVVVKTAGNADSNTGKFRGRLSIVAAEDPEREAFDSNSPNAIYCQAAREYLNYQKQRWQQAVTSGNQLPPLSDFPTPPYTATQLQQAAASGLISKAPPTGVAGTHVYWPAPDAELDSNGNPIKSKVEREGNLIIADDVVYDQNAGNSLGLFAQNFVLLNDNTPSDTLTVDAVLMSKERSVSLDWDNTGRQNYNTWLEMMRSKNASGEKMERTISIKGSVIGEYIDVEGDEKGRGYVSQKFEYDLALRNQNPPFMPRPNLAQLSGGYRFMILHYLDRGSLSTAGLI